jgi:YVTN family beta-propeller protein
VNFTVTSGPYPTPSINTLNPSGAVAGGASFTLSVYGSNFVAGSKVRWNGTDRPTTVLTNTAANAQIPASEIVATGTATVTVFSPAPGGGISNSLTFTIATAGVYPKSVAVDPSGKYVYVANSGSNNVSTYAINTDGTLTRKATIAAGTNPYSVAVDPSGKFVYVANNLSNNVSMYTINADGTLSSNGTVAAGMAPSSVTVHPSGKFAYVANAGDFSNVRGDVSMYTINTTTGTLTSIGSPIAADFGAFSVAVDHFGNFAYVANIGDFDFFAGSVSMYTINSTTGALTPNGAVAAQGGTLGPISVAIDPSGKFAYVANDEGFTPAVSMYSIDTTTGKLTSIGTIGAGGFVLSVTVHPSGKFAYATSESFPFVSGNVAMYRLDTNTGALTSIGSVPEQRTPISIAIDPAGRFAYVANYDSHNISMYSIDAMTGVLTLIGRMGT